MKQVILTKHTDGTISVSSDEDPVGMSVCFKHMVNEEEQMLVALAEFFNYEPNEVLNFESIDEE